MISPGKQDELISQSFKRFEAEGKEWVSVDDDLAPDYMLRHPEKKSRAKPHLNIVTKLKAYFWIWMTGERLSTDS